MRRLLPVIAALLAVPTFAQPVVIDGVTNDWPEGEFVRCEAGWVKLRLETGRPVSLHAMTAPATVRLNIPSAGTAFDIVFSPPALAEERRRPGHRITMTADGSVSALRAEDLDLHTAPTVASRSYEVRIGVDELLEAAGVNAAPTVTVSLPGFDGSSPETVSIDLCETVPDTRAAELRDRPGAGARVIAWNVLWSSPLESPDGFARIFDATRPDVVLFQEWDRGELSADDVERWLNEHAAWADSGWTVSKPDAWGVAVATHHPMVAEGPEQLLAPGTRWDFPVRLASAVIDLPVGRTVVGSLHLKCCGLLGSEEDARRLVEAVAVRDTMIMLADLHDAEHVILGGDFNTVGTSAVLDVSVAGVDLDGSPLSFAEAIVTADDVRYTFGRPGMNNTRRLLDWIGYSDSTLDATAAFVVDTARVDASSLATMGLMSTDSAASDHLPVVVDLVPTQ